MDEATAALSPDDRVAKGLCPECGRPLAGLSPAAHAAEHWPITIFPNGTNAEAIRRQQLLLNYSPRQAPTTASKA